jgi:hypothetical protein
LSLIIAGVLGSSLLYLVTQRRALAVHLTAVIALGIGAGLLTAVATNIVTGAFHGQFPAIWGVAALFVLALALPIAFFQRLLGLPGTGVGLLVFIVVGDPSSGGATAPQLLPDPWRAFGPDPPRATGRLHHHRGHSLPPAEDGRAVSSTTRRTGLPRKRPGRSPGAWARSPATPRSWPGRRRCVPGSPGTVTVPPRAPLPVRD